MWGLQLQKGRDGDFAAHCWPACCPLGAERQRIQVCVSYQPKDSERKRSFIVFLTTPHRVLCFMNCGPLGATDIQRMVASHFTVKPLVLHTWLQMFHYGFHPPLLKPLFSYKLIFLGSRDWDLDIFGSHYSTFHNDNRRNRDQARADGTTYFQAPTEH